MSMARMRPQLISQCWVRPANLKDLLKFQRFMTKVALFNGKNRKMMVVFLLKVMS